MTQTLALLIDAYRELNARKMFWIALGISLLVVSVFAVLGINDKGILVFWWPIDLPFINTTIISRKTFYAMLFASIGLSIWLGWASTILAIVSTASIMPDFVAGGAIECTLSKPISRVRLFLTKYAGALLFVILQSLAFTLLAILAIGLRGGEWIWSLLIAVPLVTLMFSYLYCVSALVGVWTRSTLAALVAALALWGVIFAVNTVESILLISRLNAEDPVPLMQRDIEATALQLENRENTFNEEELARLRQRKADKEKTLAESNEKASRIGRYHHIAYTLKTILPKTAETKDLLERVAISGEDLERLQDRAEESNRRQGGISPMNPRVRKKLDQVQKSHSVWWVIGTSLVFEAVIVGTAAWVFRRRDF